VELDVKGALRHLEIVDERHFVLPPVTTRQVTVRVRAEPEASKGSQPIEFVVESDDSETGFKVREKSRFLIP
jgi:hypothetical protein